MSRAAAVEREVASLRAELREKSAGLPPFRLPPLPAAVVRALVLSVDPGDPWRYQLRLALAPGDRLRRDLIHRRPTSAWAGWDGAMREPSRSTAQ